MKRILLPGFILLLSAFTYKGEKNAYTLFSLKNKPTQYQAMLKAAEGADIVLFGEMHDNPICHWLEIELTKDLFAAKGANLMLGAEMFEADNQLILDSFLNGTADDKRFKAGCRLWPNYKTDYAPMVEFAKENKLTFMATNIPRRYASLVYKKGFKGLDTLSELEKSWMAPLPMAYDSNLTCYKDIFKAVGGHGTANLPKSQASKDATMAYFILKNYQKGKLFLHFNGTYHSNNFQSIYWYLKKAYPSLKIVTIASAEQKDISKLETDNKNLADFTIITPEGMTKTY